MTTMKLVYNPEGAPSQEFDFDPDNPLNLEAEALENVGGEAWMDYGGFLERIGSGNARARRALLWVMLRRTDPSLRFADVVFRFSEFEIDADVEAEPVGKENSGDASTDSGSPLPDLEASLSN
jgi:hypothetical protein